MRALRGLAGISGACLRFASPGCSFQSSPPRVFLGDEIAQEQTQKKKFFFKHLYWSIIALQWCVTFCFITK